MCRAMRFASILAAVAIIGCAARRPPPAPFRPTGPLTLAVAPLPEVGDDEPFGVAYQDPGRIALSPIGETRSKFAADRHLRFLINEIIDPTSSARRDVPLPDVIGDDELAKLREALAPADLLFVSFKWDVRQRLWRSMTAEFVYRVYDLRSGRPVAGDVLSIKTDTSSDLALTDSDPAAADKLVSDLGRRVRQQIDALLPAAPAPPPPMSN
jgi:hypothetical protein